MFTDESRVSLQTSLTPWVTKVTRLGFGVVSGKFRGSQGVCHLGYRDYPKILKGDRDIPVPYEMMCALFIGDGITGNVFVRTLPGL